MPGLQLSRAFYVEAVRPLLDEAYPGLRYAAARLGPGSDVLGFDSGRSVDHDWGPRLELFLNADDVACYGEAISAVLAERLPKRFRGWPTNFEPSDGRVRVMTPTDGPVAHRVVVTNVRAWCDELLGFDARRGVTVLDWLATPGQRLAEVTGGVVFHDDIGELTSLRDRLQWYPDDVWRYVLACQWMRIGAEEAFVGRAAEAGDEVGSRVVAARLVREVMRQCLLLACRFPPYSKWLGTAFAGLPDIAGIAAACDEALVAASRTRRQAALCAAYEQVGEWQNRLGIAVPVDATRRQFFDRPYQVIDADRFAAALLARIDDPEVAALPPVGAVDQYVDSVAVLCQPSLARAVMTAIWRGDRR
ncbi:protein of unknown function [Micromonospora phaseoli]|uniref:DUF4037 domain-containing protein n=1 Tax=Micromonospora phaseoli TaxID=1144548 RepID=A0A1H7DPR9_9ACTN|nr:DUF4037 domain-containing protein [Micromonospora phaseoli]PZV90040.1 uncharacterized protein DUF4037 [Micromonospora phaseoli]GIJ78743.1 hypothetical protein Xph01_31750 [Micromonospora phaseoli]SEK03749.1 protein of unknown function [Micromonospora phaseoli]